MSRERETHRPGPRGGPTRGGPPKKVKENLNTKIGYNGQPITRISLSSKQSHIHCKVCGCEFNQVGEKEDHMLKFHTEIKCTMCEYNAFGESGLKEHQRNKHNPLT